MKIARQYIRIIQPAIRSTMSIPERDDDKDHPPLCCVSLIGAGLFAVGVWMACTSIVTYQGFGSQVHQTYLRSHQMQIAPYYPIRCEADLCVIIKFTNAVNYTGYCYTTTNDITAYTVGQNVTLYREGWFLEKAQPVCSTQGSRRANDRFTGGIILAVIMGCVMCGGYCDASDRQTTSQRGISYGRHIDDFHNEQRVKHVKHTDQQSNTAEEGEVSITMPDDTNHSIHADHANHADQSYTRRSIIPLKTNTAAIISPTINIHGTRCSYK